jgi:hypothetical protein
VYSLLADVIADFKTCCGRQQGLKDKNMRTPHQSEDEMAKGQLRSNREKKKPKADKNKKKSTPAASPFMSNPLSGKDSQGKKFS